jgi:hypothetical protein
LTVEEQNLFIILLTNQLKIGMLLENIG